MIGADTKIIKNILLFSQPKEIAVVQSLSTKWHAVSKTPSFRAEWLSRHQDLLDQWLDKFERKYSPFSLQDWNSYHLFWAPMRPLAVSNLLLDSNVGTVLLNNALKKNNMDRLRQLLMQLLSFRSLIGVSLVLEHETLFRLVVETPVLLNFCVYACIMTPSSKDSEKGLAVLKFLLDSTTPDLQLVNSALSISGRMGLAKHVELLLSKFSFLPRKKLKIWLEMYGRPKSAALDQSLDILEASMDPKARAILPKFKQMITEDDSSFKYLWFDQVSNEAEDQHMMGIMREIWSALFLSCLKISDIEGLKRFASISSPNAGLLVSLKQFAIALKSGNDQICDITIPLLDCHDPTSTDKEPSFDRALQFLLSEYCRTPLVLLASHIDITPQLDHSAESDQQLRDFVLSHQLDAISYLVRTRTRLNKDFVISSADVWNSIQAKNTAVTKLLQSLGANASWMDNEMVPVKRENYQKLFVNEHSVGSTMDKAEVDTQSGMFQAFGGEVSSFLTMPKSSNAEWPSTTSKSSNLPARGNIFQRSYLGEKRISILDPVGFNHLYKPTGGAENVENSKSVMRQTPSNYNLQSNMIWEVYFKGDIKKLQKLMDKSSGTNFEWMDLTPPDKKGMSKKTSDSFFHATPDSSDLKGYAQLF